MSARYDRVYTSARPRDVTDVRHNLTSCMSNVADRWRPSRLRHDEDETKIGQFSSLSSQQKIRGPRPCTLSVGSATVHQVYRSSWSWRTAGLRVVIDESRRRVFSGLLSSSAAPTTTSSTCCSRHNRTFCADISHGTASTTYRTPLSNLNSCCSLVIKPLQSQRHLYRWLPINHSITYHTLFVMWP